VGLRLLTYRYSVYGRIARMALHVRGQSPELVEVDPFANPPDPALAAISPFGRVPVLDHDGFVLTETAAITRYVAAVFPGPPLVPGDPRGAARMAELVGILDAYGYRPMIRQVFAEAVFAPAVENRPGDPAAVASGMAASAPVLDRLDALAAEGRVLAGPVTLADLHLAPMLDYFAMHPPAARAIADRPALAAWWHGMRDHPACAATDPGLASGSGEG
jgi:glutathione S-transferase